MIQRVITALWAIPLVLIFACFDIPGLDFPLLIFLIGLVAILGVIEFYRLAGRAGGQPLTLFGTVWALAFVVAAHFDNLYVTYTLLASSAVLPLIWLAWFRREAKSGTDEERRLQWPLRWLAWFRREAESGTDEERRLQWPLRWLAWFRREAAKGPEEESRASLSPGQLSAHRRQRVVASWAWTLAGILYMGWMLSHYVTLRELDHGRELVLLVLFSTFACDTVAFLIGRTWGRHLMAPAISPKKTWEGAVAGFGGAVAAALALRSLLNLGDWELPLSYIQTVALGCLIGLFAQLGDLLESLIKRRAGAKDSGRLMPGHGGILDRVDSLVFTGAIVYYYVIWVVD
jgi:CDP-diglyceride synthetase